MPSLPGSDKYRKAAEEPPQAVRRAAKEIEFVNRRVPIQSVLYDYYLIAVPRELSKSWKTRCPFSYEHLDGGVEKNLRVYPTNHAYCFALHGQLTCVKIEQIRSECGALQAARRLMRLYGLSMYEPYWERMKVLVAEREMRSAVGSSIDAVHALQTALMATPGYPSRQFDPDVLQVMEEWLEKLDALMWTGQEGVVRRWFRVALQEVSKVVEHHEG